MHTLNLSLACVILALLSARAAAGAQPPFEAMCAATLHPAFTVNAIPPSYRVDNTVSTRVLHNRSMHHHSSDLMLGMTDVTTRIEVGIDGRTLQDPLSGRECLAPQIDVELRYQPMNVFIAREFHDQSCPYREVLAHEMRHVKLYLEHLPKVEAQVRKELEQRFGATLLYTSSGQGLAALQEQIDTWLRPMLRAEMRKVERYQARLDTEEESYRLSAACNGELAYSLKARY